MKDKAVKKLIDREVKRSAQVVNLIASENCISKDVTEALASLFGNKYAEGYPAKRYYKGNAVVDELETLCQERALKVFSLSPKKWSVNVQALSGSPANLAALFALLPQGGKVMGMSLSHGGHLTHGHSASQTGKLWTQIPYGVSQKDGKIDYTEVMEIAKKEHPQVIIAGFTAYARVVNWKKFREIADAVGAYLVVDLSHVAGLVAGGVYPSPFRYADIVTTTTHKTLRGPRGAMIFSKRDGRDLPSKIDKAVFPGLQGGPHENVVAAIAVALGEAMQPSFCRYARQVVANAQVLSNELSILGWKIISGGTDSHMFLVDTWMDGRGISGGGASDALEKHGIIVNMNTIPNDTRRPLDPSGIRLGTAYETTRGAKEKDMRQIAKKIDTVLRKAMLS